MPNTLRHFRKTAELRPAKFRNLLPQHLRPSRQDCLPAVFRTHHSHPPLPVYPLMPLFLPAVLHQAAHSLVLPEFYLCELLQLFPFPANHLPDRINNSPESRFPFQNCFYHQRFPLSEALAEKNYLHCPSPSCFLLQPGHIRLMKPQSLQPRFQPVSTAKKLMHPPAIKQLAMLPTPPFLIGLFSSSL